ncbi:histidine kinase [Antarcticibacterium sp. 1MA-6-2]|uniref:sensor histidine kinase n=1 Tax=Antarcticibacterium sp. 1MA-6-2 TaxID=2908210 RepID=UPI001F2FBCE3|nr:sensor histidine kinase [Antarcticibacterium sp. 1MA-6-2]UJH90718.1 histidine kinase [Antarcticibacterium sp. 1MA-6-2]
MSVKGWLQREFYVNSSTSFKVTTVHHIIFWTIYFLFNFLRWGSYYDNYALSLKGNLLGFPIHIILSYFTIYFLLPRYIYSRKFFKFSILLLAALFIMVYIKFYLTYFLISNNVWPEGPVETSRLTANYIITMMLGELYVVSFATAIKLTIDWMQENKRVSTLEKTHLETELRFLRSQISPHFFFNTLNNIYSLTLERSNKASDTILKLSELMRYLLYDTIENKQYLSKEIMCLQNYMDLEKIRYGQSLKINMAIGGDIEDKLIAPMLLIPFLENAFKHGANKNLGKVFINLDLQVENSFLYFKITNTLPHVQDSLNLSQGSGGIGIANVKKRLELGYKKGEYELKNYEKDQSYIVELKLKLE